MVICRAALPFASNGEENANKASRLALAWSRRPGTESRAASRLKIRVSVVSASKVSQDSSSRSSSSDRRSRLSATSRPNTLATNTVIASSARCGQPPRQHLITACPQGRTDTASAALVSRWRGVTTWITGPISDASRLARAEPRMSSGIPRRLNETTSAVPPGRIAPPLPSHSAIRTLACWAMNSPAARYCSSRLAESARTSASELPDVNGTTGAEIACASSASNSAALPALSPGSKSRRYSSIGIGIGATRRAPCASATRATSRSAPSASDDSTMIGFSALPCR